MTGITFTGFTNVSAFPFPTAKAKTILPHNLAQDIYTIDNNALRVQGALGHRSKKSTEFYIDKDKESS